MKSEPVTNKQVESSPALPLFSGAHASNGAGGCMPGAGTDQAIQRPLKSKVEPMQKSHGFVNQLCVDGELRGYYGA